MYSEIQLPARGFSLTASWVA